MLEQAFAFGSGAAFQTYAAQLDGLASGLAGDLPDMWGLSEQVSVLQSQNPTSPRPFGQSHSTLCSLVWSMYPVQLSFMPMTLKSHVCGRRKPHSCHVTAPLLRYLGMGVQRPALQMQVTRMVRARRLARMRRRQRQPASRFAAVRSRHLPELVHDACESWPTVGRRQPGGIEAAAVQDLVFPQVRAQLVRASVVGT